MGLQQCHECKKDVSSEAKACPNCGAPVKKKTSASTKIIGGIVVFLVLMAVIGTLSSPTGNAPRTPSPTADPSTASDAQIYREFEICMNRAKKVIDEDKMGGQSIAANCMLDLKKYGDARAKKAFNMYFDLGK